MATKIIPKKSSVVDKVPLTTDLDVGEIAINLADKKLYTKNSTNEVITIGNTEELKIHIRADEAISKGDVLYATGALGASGKITASKFIANNTIDELYLVGLADRDLAIGEHGYAISLGEIFNLNTTGSTVSETWSEGTILYASPTTAGKFTSTQPEAPNQDITVAMVLSVNANSGSIFVRPTPGFHLNELHDVYAPSPTNGQVLAWNSTNSRWEATTAGGGGTPTTPGGVNTSIQFNNNGSFDGSASLTWSGTLLTTDSLFTTGSASFSGETFFFDSVSFLPGSTTRNVFNTEATTVNAFGAATTVNLGATTGTTTIRNNLSTVGNITVTGTVDGRDIATDGSKLDGIESGADVTDAGNVNPLVDSHLNTATATTNQVLSWTGSDYDWVDQSGGTGGGITTGKAIAMAIVFG